MDGKIGARHALLLHHDGLVVKMVLTVVVPRTDEGPKQTLGILLPIVLKEELEINEFE